jgi:hypothetical protein
MGYTNRGSNPSSGGLTRRIQRVPGSCNWQTDLSPSPSADGALPLRPSCLNSVYWDGIRTIIITTTTTIITTTTNIRLCCAVQYLNTLHVRRIGSLFPKLGTVFFSSVGKVAWWLLMFFSVDSSCSYSIYLSVAVKWLRSRILFHESQNGPYQ